MNILRRILPIWLGCAALSYAACCAPQEAQVVNTTNLNIASLEQLKKETDKTLLLSRGLVQVAMANNVEKENTLSILVKLKNNSNLRADLKAALVRAILLRTEAGELSLGMDFNEAISKEMLEVEEKK